MKRIEESGEISFKQAFIDFWRGLFSFGGRSTRKGYWYGVLMMPLTILMVVTGGIVTLNIILAMTLNKVVGSFLIISLLIETVVYITISIGSTALFFRRMRDVGFKTAPLVIWIVITVLFLRVPLLGFVIRVINIWLLYVLSVPTGHFVKEYQNGFMKFLFEEPENFKFCDDLRVIKFNPNGTEETIEKGKIMERGKVSFKQAVHDFFHGILSFGGRSTRAGYWKSQLLIIPIYIVVMGIVITLTVFTFNTISHALTTMPDLSFGDGLGAFLCIIFIVLLALLGPGLLITGLMIPVGVANWSVMIRRLRDVGLKLKTMFIGWGIMAILDSIIWEIFTVGYGSPQGMLWALLWEFGIDLTIQIIFLCLPTGAMATQKENSIFFENKAIF
ncbi:DUF805 domain-containing protein [Ligilactobacillus araffinosus]|uniref:Integral membrane protein n=1 Tax=Ligilactobacillus araffinosus DSM 20653 TaxID=1423820 RepID=A0A0R1ZRP7_9LACO|nr:DUF805 domain-containing protein [Ligilactobacillus araffinosus]KRM53244.1 hypothetical protein FC64_GL000815 [Ligilactobacillus araffinosus DSM 20653]